MAAIAVLTRHVPDATLLNLLPGSALAVDLFFVLSGFVLAHAYTERLLGQMSAWSFMRVRIIRLYPLYILGSAIGTVHFVLASGIDLWAWSKIAGCLLFAIAFLPTFPALSPDAHPFPLNFPAWSLFYELLINFVFALLILHKARRLLIAVIAVGLALLIFTGLYFGDLYAGSRFDNFWGGGGRVVYSFFMGVAAYHLWAKDRLSWIRIPAPVSIIVLLATFAAEPIAGGGRAYYDLFVAIVVFPALVLGSARREPTGHLNTVCEKLGLASYAIYVMQAPVILWCDSLSNRLLGHRLDYFGVSGSIFIVCLVVILSLLLDRFYDLRAREFMKRNWSRLFSRRAEVGKPAIRSET